MECQMYGSPVLTPRSRWSQICGKYRECVCVCVRVRVRVRVCV